MTKYLQYKTSPRRIWGATKDYTQPAVWRPTWWHTRSSQSDGTITPINPPLENAQYAVDFDTDLAKRTTAGGGEGDYIAPSQGDGIFRLQGTGIFIIHLGFYMHEKIHTITPYIDGSYRTNIHSTGQGIVQYKTVINKSSASSDGQIRIVSNVSSTTLFTYGQQYLTIYRIGG